MKVKVEIDVTPEELRRFLGLPDVAGLQDDLIAFLRDKVGAASDFDATGFVRNNLDALRKSPAWKNIAARIRIAEAGEDEGDTDAPPRKRGRRSRAKDHGGE